MHLLSSLDRLLKDVFSGSVFSSALFPCAQEYCMYTVCSVADPDPGTGTFYSWIRDRFFPDPGSWIQTHIFES
jgi:hypothetical protein